ncbi:MAG TPA: M23 family metallopeptidase [Novosphingobium sp.]|nr:M23 family metallopeptidase [Novosphingobium sp.]
MLAALAAFPFQAQANSAANADIAAPLRAAQASQQGAGESNDQQFRQLFASWRSIDGSGPATAAARPGVGLMAMRSVSIPSRIPLDGMRLSSDFGMRHHPVLGGYRMHKGIDLSSPVGTPVYATADGVVARADWFSSYGLYIQIEHGGAIETRFGHLSRLNVAAGQFVHKGDLIGFVGTTGRSTGPHLHYEVRVEGVAVNPVPYMQGESSAQLALAGGNGGHGAAANVEDDAD